MIPSHQVGQILPRQILEVPILMFVDFTKHLKQALVRRIRFDHRDMVAAKATIEQQLALVHREVVQILTRQQAQQGVANLAALELARVVF